MKAVKRNPLQKRKLQPWQKKTAPKKAADSDESSDDAPAPKAKPKAAAAESDDSDEAPAAKKPKTATGPLSPEELTVFVGGLPFSVTKETFEKDFSECGEIESLRLPLNDEGTPRGIAFITYKTKEAVDKALAYDATDYGGRYLKVNIAGQKGEKGKGKDGKGDKGKGKVERDNTKTAFVRGLPFSVTEDVFRKDFSECGEIENLRMPLNEEGNPKGIAFIQYATKEGFEAALKFNETDYGGRTIYVSQAGEKGDGKGKDGKDGKGKDGKGKDGKGKGKKGKNKSGLSDEKRAAQSGAMVEGTGVKQSFDSDDSDEEKPAKKVAKKAPAKDDSDSS